ncbi:hypothetical protein DFP73DRAFT_481198 [Morchella snyderi]|nr:hypothetical protein DFP73DRAFT_481198 [Morchella snyderi]
MKFLLASLLASVASAFTVTGTFAPSPHLPNPALLPPTTSLTLTTSGTTARTLISTSNGFTFHNISAGSYLLDVACPSHHFAPLRVDVTGSGDVSVHTTFRGNEWSNLGEARPYPVMLHAIKTADYYVVREGFNPTKLLANPMILVAIVSLVAIVGLPKLVDKMDPELKAEFEESQKKVGAAQANPLGGFDVASFLAGTSKPATPEVKQSGKGRRN